MTPTERVSRLVGLLERIRRNAAEPRPTRTVSPAANHAEVSALLHPAEPLATEFADDLTEVLPESLPPASLESEPPTLDPRQLAAFQDGRTDADDDPTLQRPVAIDLEALAAARRDEEPPAEEPAEEVEFDEVVFDEESIREDDSFEDDESGDAPTYPPGAPHLDGYQRVHQPTLESMAREAALADAARVAAERADAERAEAERATARSAAQTIQERSVSPRETIDRIEQARLERERAEQAEAARLARIQGQRSETERLALQEAERVEAERFARIEAERAAERAEAERMAELEAERAEVARIAAEAGATIEDGVVRRSSDEVPIERSPISSRQPKLEDYESVDDFDELLDDERPPESGEVASQRQPGIVDEATMTQDLVEWEHEEPSVPRSATRSNTPASMNGTAPPPAPSSEVARVEVRLAVESAPPLAEVVAMPVEVRADSFRRPTIVGDAASFVGAARTYRPESFGDLLDASLALGGSQTTD